MHAPRHPENIALNTFLAMCLVWDRVFGRTGISLACAILVSCSLLSPAQAALVPCPSGNGPVYLDKHDVNKTSVVVFVHGVLSSAVSAWRDDADHSWPCLLRDEPVFNNSNIYLYAYDNNLLEPNPPIEKVAKQLLRDLENEGVLNHAHVTIVAHSMGGLVTARMLLLMNGKDDMRAKLNRIKLVQFYGTPATGADLANLASFFSDNPQFAEMRTGSSQQDLIDKWASVAWPFPWYCLAEGKRTGWAWGIGTMVVPFESATALCRKQPSRMDKLERFNHVNMVKPTTLQDTPHRYLKRNFVSCVSGALPHSAPTSEANSGDGQLVLTTLARLRAALADNSGPGRDGALAKVQETLYLSDGLSDSYLIPSNLGQPSLSNKAFERLGGRPFALELIKLFQTRPAELSAQWVGRVGVLEKYVPDGQLIELRQAWISAGLVRDNDVVVALERRDTGEQVFIVGAVQGDPPAERQARIRGLLILPPQPRTCI